MADEFVKYRSFIDKAIATELCRQLGENNIPFKWESTEGFFDVSFANSEIHHYYIKLRREDFKKADELLMKAVAESKEQPADDYYLFSFSNEELIEVLKNADEWNEFDQYWAKKILSDRGVETKQEEIEQAKVQKLAELKKPWIANKVWLIGAVAIWLAALWFIHLFWAIAVIFISGYILFSKKTMPDGERVKAFSEDDRFFGIIILVAGILLAIYILLQYYGIVEFMRPL